MTHRDHTKLICDVSELGGLFIDATSLETFLQEIVKMVAAHMQADVCSIYLYYEDRKELVLTATQGLSASAVGKVSLKLGEGLTGVALKEYRALREGHVHGNPQYRYFPGIGEEEYESFLAVPIVRGLKRIGVMVLQSIEKNYFTENDARVFRAITSQLANTIETAKFYMMLDRDRQEEPLAEDLANLKVIKGRIGSKGCAYGDAFVVGDEAHSLLHMDRTFARIYTIQEFHRALEDTEAQLERLQSEIETKLFDVASLIFTAHILMLKDQMFIEAIDTLITEGVNPPVAIIQVVEDYVGRFSAMSDPYLQDKKYDVLDVGKRLLENLTGRESGKENLHDKIIIAQELYPSDALKFYSKHIKGIVLLSGGVTSHLSILSRSLELPLVIVDERRLMAVPEGSKILLDALTGNVYINPAEDIVRQVEAMEKLRSDAQKVKGSVKPETHTADGVRVHLLANINLVGDVEAANEYMAEGIGLYRTEFPFMARSTFPSEEEQYLIYRRLVEGMPGKPITIRTLDVGGDKLLSYYDYGHEDNPFLGLRSIRFSLRHQDVFEQQLKAILRAGHDADVRILFPMISSLDEFYKARACVLQCQAELKAQGTAYQLNPRLGIMIELPSILEVIDEVAEEADFLSVGTNDLIQYLLAVDRTNQKVADMYLPYHPSVLRALKKIVTAAERFGKEVTVCGDMANDERYIAGLVGLGFRKLSLDARYIPAAQNRLAQIRIDQWQLKAAQMLQARTVEALTPFVRME